MNLRSASLKALFRPATLALALLTLSIPAANAASQLKMYPVPAEVASSHFRVSIDGHSSDVLHAATGYYLLNFDTDGPVTVSVTADDPHFWDAGVEVQPMRLGIRPTRKGATITFPMAGPSKLTITRPGDHFADADILFLFANPIDHSGITAATPKVRYYGPGVHHENIDAQSGDTIYLAGGAVIFGSLNLWQVHDVHVFGTGTIIYDGPQDPLSDTGWMHKKNWHVIVMDNATNIEIDGITAITRSRSWQVQMRDSRHIGLYNIKVIGGNPNNANQDGIDWLGGGDTTIRNSFFRASDDVFAAYGNWDGYEPALLKQPGHDVTNITIEDTIASTSISNIVRIAWPEKTFNSAHFHMSDMDVIHSGYGGCKVPFAFFELWANPDGHGSHTDYSFDNIRMDDWYSLFNIDHPNAAVRDISFTNIWAMDGPAMVPSILKGNVSGVRISSNATEQGFAGSATQVSDGAAPPERVFAQSLFGAEFSYTAGLLHAKQSIAFTGIPSVAALFGAEFSYTAGLLHAKQSIAFTGIPSVAEGIKYEWIFGDGTRAEGREVHHAFPDTEGTLLDHSGRFRVLLHVTGPRGEQAWGSQQVVLSQPSIPPFGKFTTTFDDGTKFFNGNVRIPADGGYTFTLLTSLSAKMNIDGYPQRDSPTARPQVCGSKGDAVQAIRTSITLSAGVHRIHIARTPGIENAQSPPGPPTDNPILLWEGPGIERQLIPQSAFAPEFP